MVCPARCYCSRNCIDRSNRCIDRSIQELLVLQIGRNDDQGQQLIRYLRLTCHITQQPVAPYGHFYIKTQQRLK